MRFQESASYAKAMDMTILTNSQLLDDLCDHCLGGMCRTRIAEPPEEN